MKIMTVLEDKKKILKLFKNNVLGKAPDTESFNQRHDGKDGHWLEAQMGIARNGDNAPDLFGFEMKNQTTSKTSFGDWSADYYIFKKNPIYPSLNKETFLKIFGKPYMQKGGRLSWSGEPIPKINNWNNFGCILLVDDSNNILIQYSYSKDLRQNKSFLVPIELQQENLILVSWSASRMKNFVERKFNQNGWFKCLKDSSGSYCSIVFGEPMTFLNWIELVKQGIVFFDSGMYAGNSRPYSMWRASNIEWTKLGCEEFNSTKLSTMDL